MVSLTFWFLTWELDEMLSYLDTMLLSISDSQARLQKRVDEMAIGLENDRKEELYEAYADEYHELVEDFPRRLRRNFIVNWYSLVEDRLVRICDELRHARPEWESVEFNRSIHDAGRFLRQVVGYEIDQAHWREVHFVRQARNQIVHANSRLPCSKRPYQDSEGQCRQIDLNGERRYLRAEPNFGIYLMKHSMLRLSNQSCVIDPSPDYCRYLVEFAKEFFERIYVGTGILPTEWADRQPRTLPFA